MGRQGLFDDSGYQFNVPYEMCERCAKGIMREDAYEHRYYECEIKAKDIDFCEFEGVEDDDF